MHIFLGPRVITFQIPRFPLRAPSQHSLTYLLECASTWLQGGGYGFWYWQWVEPVYEAGGGEGWRLSRVMLLIYITEAMSDGGVYERTLTVQAQMGGWWLKGNVIAVSKHLENSHRKWKQDLLGERPEGRAWAAGWRVGVQRTGYHLIGKTYPGSLEHLNSACVI